MAGWASHGLAAERAALPDFLIRTWDSEDGLPTGPIRATARTPDGYLWIATGNGLMRFDGARFVAFNTNNTPALADNRTSCLLVDAAGDLWVGTSGGTLARRRAGDFASLPIIPPLPGIPINALAQDASGAIWVATEGAGLARWREGSWDFFTQSNGLPGDGVSQLAAAGGNDLWALAAGQLVRWDGSRWTQVAGWESGGGRGQALAKSRDGGLWVATVYPQATGGHGGQVRKFKDGQWTAPLPPYPWPYLTQPPRITALIEDRAGRIWLGTIDAGLRWWETGRPWETLSPENRLRQIGVNCLAEDAAGSLWVGFNRSDQLQQVRTRPVQTLRLPAVAGQSRVYAVSASRDGSAWIGTSDAGVFHHRDGQFRQFTEEAGLADRRICTLLEDARTNLWVGTWGGLFRQQGDRFERVTGPEALRSQVLALCEDRRGTLWAGTQTGLVRLAGTQSAMVENSAGLPIRAIQESLRDELWVAGVNGRLYRLRDGRLEPCEIPDWPTGTVILSLHADAHGALWIGTMAQGLLRLKDGQLRHWSTSDGLPSDRLPAILEDMDGCLWFSSDNGFFGCSPGQFDLWRDDPKPPPLFRRLATADGLETKMGSGAGNPVASRSPDGRLWFPNQFAVAVFDPAALTPGGSAPPPLVEEVVADNRPLIREADGGLRAKSSSRHFEFRYTVPNLESPDRQRFWFRLKGWEAEWVDAGSQRVAHYSHLPPGQYEFEVRAGGPDGLWRAAQPALRLAVMPLIWERRWVQALGVFLLLAAAGSGTWYLERLRSRRRLARLEQQRALELERRRIARDLHDDLGSRLTEVMLMGEGVEHATASLPESRHRLGQMLGKVRQLVGAMDQVVWTVTPENDTLPNLVGYASNFAQEFLEAAGISCRLDVPVNLPHVMVAAPVRLSLFLAVKEALNNAVKHAGASEVWLRVTCSTQELCLSVGDNGKGFEPGRAEGAGHGLRNLRQRLAGIGGRAEWSSAPGQGTTARFFYPLDRPGLARTRR